MSDHTVSNDCLLLSSTVNNLLKLIIIELIVIVTGSYRRSLSNIRISNIN